VNTADPGVAGAELEAGQFRLLLDRIQGGEQNAPVNAVARRHLEVSLLDWSDLREHGRQGQPHSRFGVLP
jgi:hypothetical protein